MATGVLVETAEVDGALDHLLDLENQLAATLLISAGWKVPLPKRVRAHLAPRVVSAHGEL